MSDPNCFSTKASEPSKRMEAWRRYLAETYFNLGVRTKDDDVFGEIVSRTYGSIGVSSLAVSPTRVSRSRQSAGLDKVERFCFVFPTQSTFEHRQRGLENKTEAGSVFVVNSAEPYEVDNAEDCANFCLTVPCDQVRARRHDIDDLCARSGFADPLIASTLRHLVQATVVEGLRTDEAAFEDLCLDMLELMLSRSGETRHPAEQTTGSRAS